MLSGAVPKWAKVVTLVVTKQSPTPMVLEFTNVLVSKAVLMMVKEGAFFVVVLLGVVQRAANQSSLQFPFL